MKKKILVIEDNLEVRENICEILELDAYEVVSAENGKIGVEKALEVNPDIILCDVMMPVLDGFGVLKILNKNPKVNHIPFIFLTAKAEKEDIRKGMGLGAEDYIVKPFDDTELLEAIEIRLKKAERIKELFNQTDDGLQNFFSSAKANDQLEELSLDKEIRHYKVKDEVYREGQNAHWLYFIVTGQVKIFQTNDDGKDFITQIYNEGDFFGYFSLLHDTPYNHSASCIKETTLRLIPKADFSLLLFNNRDFSAQFVKMLANRTEDTEKQLIDLAYSSVRKKVANSILLFAKKHTENKTQNISISVSREDLASKAGTAKETLIRTLSDFKQEGLIDIQSKSIIIRDLEDLSDIIA